MPKVTIGKDGSIRFPDAYLSRHRVPLDTEWWLEAQGNALSLLPRVPDLAKLYIEPTTECNLNCRTCVRNSWEEPLARMDFTLFSELLKQSLRFPALKRIVFCGIGEPLTHPRILDMVAAAKEHDLAVTMVSNGTLMDKAMSVELIGLGADRLVISIDGASPETFAGVRGAELSQILANLRGLKEAKAESGSVRPALEFEFVALKRNVMELAGIFKLASELAANRVLVSNVLAYTEELRKEVLYGYEPRAPLVSSNWPVKTDAWVLLGTSDMPRMHWGAEQSCPFVRDRAVVIGWDGEVLPCLAYSHSYSYHAVDGLLKHVERYSMGNILQSSLFEIWTAEEYCRFRNQVECWRFPSCPDCELRESCDLRESNEGCWGWNPSCSDCLYAQDIVRCPEAHR